MEIIELDALSRFVASVEEAKPVYPNEPLSQLSDSDTELINLHIDYCVALHQLVPGDADSKRLWRQIRLEYAQHFEAWAVKHGLGYHFTE